MAHFDLMLPVNGTQNKGGKMIKNEQAHAASIRRAHLRTDAQQGSV